MKKEQISVGKRRESLRVLLEQTFKTPLISRYDPDLNVFVSGGTLANEDSAGTGIEGRVMIGRKTFYPREHVINWLLAHAK